MQVSLAVSYCCDGIGNRYFYHEPNELEVDYVDSGAHYRGLIRFGTTATVLFER